MNQSLPIRWLQAGEQLFNEGDPGDFAYIIEQGEIEISTKIQGHASVLNILKAGEMLGELALIDGQPRSASATARTDALLILVTPEQIEMRLQTADPILRMLLLVTLGHFRSQTGQFHQLLGENKHLCTKLPERLPEAIDAIRMEGELRTALEREQFTLYYQPIVHLETSNIAGFEALIRWQTPHRGYVRPDIFMALAESTSLIVPIGKWIIEEGIRGLRHIEQQTGQQLFMSFNIASRQIEEVDFVDKLVKQVGQAGIQPNRIKLEILERCLLEGEIALEWLRRCRFLGFPLVLDDFGTGYSSLEYLNAYDLDTLKIDKSFVQNLDENPHSLSICQTIIQLSNALGMTVVAEGVEKATHVEKLRHLGCTFGQGYFFSQALSLEGAIAIVGKNSPLGQN